jgi:hypothetical protein
MNTFNIDWRVVVHRVFDTVKDALRVVVANDSSNPIPVEFSESGEKINEFSEVTAVASGAETTILTYAVPPSKVLVMDKIEVSGTNISTFKVKIDGNDKARMHTWFNGNLGHVFDFNGLQLNAGSIILIRALHNRPTTGDFEARLLARLKDA